MRRQLVPFMRFSFLVGFLAAVFTFVFPKPPSLIAAGEKATPQGQRTELALDDGQTPCVGGPAQDNRGKPGFGWANKLTPATYPATLRSVTIAFSRAGEGVEAGQLYRIVVYIDPENDGPADGQQPDVTFLGRIRGTDQFITFDLISPVRIESGSFVIGVLDEFGVAKFPAPVDVPGKSTPPGSESFLTTNGGGRWDSLAENPLIGPSPCNGPGSWLIRATVETDPVDTFRVTATIKDPLAVEPWGVTATASRVFVTNLVSDNLTIVNTTDNSFQNLPVGDGPGGNADGPFGSVVLSPANKVFVTLFGSNTIPSKEFPIDYTAVGPGRVAILSQANGIYSQVATVNVGKGPMFPALAPIEGGKIYVPCSGDNRVDVISGVTNLKIRDIPVGKNPTSCTLALFGQKLYVTNFGDGTISVINTATDQVIKTIPLSVAGVPPAFPTPWKAAISPANGNLYVTISGAAGDSSLTGSIAEINTCGDALLRFITDDSTRGTAAGSAGSTGIPAPTAPLVRDAATGTTPGAGGGGGGPFGIASFRTDILNRTDRTPVMVFTNDGPGLIGAFDSRTDVVVSAPHLRSCPKPRDIAGTRVNNLLVAYAACGQPDNSILVINVPAPRPSISDFPVVESVERGGKLRIRGAGLVPPVRIEAINPDTGACLTFAREPKFKKKGTLVLFKGDLSDGRNVGEAFPSNSPIFLRVIAQDGTAFIYSQPAAVQ